MKNTSGTSRPRRGDPIHFFLSMCTKSTRSPLFEMAPRQPAPEYNYVFNRDRLLAQMQERSPYPINASSSARTLVVENPSAVAPTRNILQGQIAHGNRFISPPSSLRDPMVRLFPGPRSYKK